MMAAITDSSHYYTAYSFLTSIIIIINSLLYHKYFRLHQDTFDNGTYQLSFIAQPGFCQAIGIDYLSHYHILITVTHVYSLLIS